MGLMNKPFKLAPASKDYLWGGSRLNDDFNFNIPVTPFAEAWVCSTHKDGVSFVPACGCSLAELIREHPEFLGSHARDVADGDFPILIKLIDAKEKLSVQVHPDDEYAAAEGQLGKTEMWYVLDAKPDAEIIYGFNADVSADMVRNAVSDGSIEAFLNHIPVQKNDVFMVNPGTVHAIGAGCLIAEIQESSNLTYRLYDYRRLDKHGQLRPLHIGRALDIAKLESSAFPRQPLRILKYKPGCASELLGRCKYFQVERLLLNTEVQRDLVPFRTGSNSFHALLVVDGCGSVTGEDYSLNFFKGDCIFIPAESIPLKLHGRAQILNVSC